MIDSPCRGARERRHEEGGGKVRTSCTRRFGWDERCCGRIQQVLLHAHGIPLWSPPDGPGVLELAACSSDNLTWWDPKLVKMRSGLSFASDGSDAAGRMLSWNDLHDGKEWERHGEIPTTTSAELAMNQRDDDETLLAQMTRDMDRRRVPVIIGHYRANRRALLHQISHEGGSQSLPSHSRRVLCYHCSR